VIDRIVPARWRQRPGRWAGKWRTHDNERAEEIGTYECTGRRRQRPEIVTDDARHGPDVERCSQRHHVPDQVEECEWCEIVFEADRGRRRAAIAALVGRDHVIAG